MGYRIDPGLVAGDEIRRVLAEQLGRAARDLRVPGGPDAEAVHDVRKRVKKARSLLRLARADIGQAVARHANAELRQVGVDLSTQRDADSLVEALDRLLAAAGDRPTHDALLVVRARFVERADQLRRSGSLDRATLLGAARVLEQLAGWIDLVPPRAEGWDAVGPGFARQYKRGRLALEGLPDEPTDEELHEWRKRVKDLWYHQRLLRRLWPDVQRPVVTAADSLASALGDDHDLGILLAHLVPAGDDAPHGGEAPDEPDELDDLDEVGEAVEVDPEHWVLVVAITRAERARLQAHARRVGARLYADGPDAWADRHRAWWAEAVEEATQDRDEGSEPACEEGSGAGPGAHAVPSARHDQAAREGTDPAGGNVGEAPGPRSPDPSPRRANA